MNVAQEILNGSADAQLDEVQHALKERQKLLARVRVRTLSPGDTVKFNSTVRPKYLIGVEGTVRKVNQTSVTVDLSEPHGRFHRGIRVPVTLVE